MSIITIVLKVDSAAIDDEAIGKIVNPIVAAIDRHRDVTQEGFALVAEAISKIHLPAPEPSPRYHFEGGGFMKSYPEDRPAENVAFTKPQVVDSEGGAVDPQPELNYTFSSSNDSIVAVTDNGDGTIGVVYGKANKLADGSYEIAEVRAESNSIDLGNGQTLKDVKTEQVQLLPGTAAGFAGGGFAFPDNAPPAPPATV